MKALTCEHHRTVETTSSHIESSTVKDSSVVAVQIFDQRKFKRKDQGFLGVVNVRVSDVLDLELGGHGMSECTAMLGGFTSIPVQKC